MSITSNPGVNYHPVRSPWKRSTRRAETFNNGNDQYEHQYSLNSLWSIWYGTIAIAFQIYIVVMSVKRFTSYVSLEWPNDQPPYKELNAYVIMIGVGVVMLPFFVVSAMMKIGNNANDGTKLGDEKPNYDEEAVYENIHCTLQSSKREHKLRWMLLIWKHSLPTVALLHTLAALCFLISRLLMDAQVIKYGFLEKDNIWKSEMDFIVNRFENKRSTLSQLDDVTNYSRKNEVYKATQDESLIFRSNPGGLDLHSAMFSLEFVNLAVALAVNTVRYPSIFWKVSKSFGFLLSIIFIVNTVLSLISYSSFTVLYKMQVFGAEKFIMRYPIKLSLDCTQSLFLSVVYLISVLISNCTLYYYGLDKYEERQKNAFIKFHITNKRGPLMWGYCPHFCAFLSLMVIAFSAIPLMYDLIVVYCGTSRLIFVIGASSIASHIIFSILCWLFLTFKNDWKFSSSFDQKANKMSATEQTKPLMKGEPPLLIIQNGKTFQIRENSSKNAIIHLVHNLLPTQNSQSPVSNEDIYWLKPRPPSPVEESKNLSESCSMSWLRSKKKCDTNRKTNSLKSKATLNKNKKKNNKSRKSSSIEVDVDNSEDVEYCTFREIVHRDETDENIVNSTHLSLCPLKDEPCVQNFNSTKMNGDYEVFMEPNTVPNKSVISPYSLEQRSTLYSKSAMHNEIENSCSGSLSESSTSPEKSSETSSGIHSNLSSSTEKRSNSVENLIHLMSSKQNWENKHSLQRCMPSVDKPQRVVCVANENNVNTIRRLRPHTHLEVGDCNHIYGRIPARMTSFSESDHYENSDTKSKCMMPATQVFQFDELKSLPHTNEIHTDPSSAIALMYQHQRRDSANFSLASSESDSNTQKI